MCLFVVDRLCVSFSIFSVKSCVFTYSLCTNISFYFDLKDIRLVSLSFSRKVAILCLFASSFFLPVHSNKVHPKKASPLCIGLLFLLHYDKNWNVKRIGSGTQRRRHRGVLCFKNAVLFRNTYGGPAPRLPWCVWRSVLNNTQHSQQRDRHGPPPPQDSKSQPQLASCRKPSS